MVPLKRRKLVSHKGNSGNNTGVNSGNDRGKFPDVVVFLCERKMGTSRRCFLSQLGLKNGFNVVDKFSENVTHVISENNSGDEVRAWLESQSKGSGSSSGSGSNLSSRTLCGSVNLLDICWFTDSMRAGRPVDIQDTHTLQEERQTKVAADVQLFSVPSFACQRRTTLENHNSVLTEALSLLAEHAELSGEEGRGVAFRRAAAVLKCLPADVSNMQQLSGLPCLGEHSLRVIKDILENGSSSEAESTRQSERYKALKLLTGIFGVGCRTADRWFREGIVSLEQLKESDHTLNRAQQAGLDHYGDLNRPVSRADADIISDIISRALRAVLPGATLTLIGGFRRGKVCGHDVDFLISHPEEGAEVGLMPKIVNWLQTQGFILYQKTSRNSYLECSEGPARPSSNMDRFERCFSIFRLDTSHQKYENTPQNVHSQTHTDGQMDGGQQQSVLGEGYGCKLDENYEKPDIKPENVQSHSHNDSQMDGGQQQSVLGEGYGCKLDENDGKNEIIAQIVQSRSHTNSQMDGEHCPGVSEEKYGFMLDKKDIKSDNKPQNGERELHNDSQKDGERSQCIIGENGGLKPVETTQIKAPEEEEEEGSCAEEEQQHLEAEEKKKKKKREEVCEERRWRAVRVDLVVSPISQLPFALLGWTGSKLFERELRRWAGQQKNMSLSSHALYDNTQKKYLRASTEEEIFSHLGLEFIPPSQRNA